MPRYLDKAESADAKSSETAWYYRWPADQVIGPGIAERLREWRKEYIKCRENWLEIQKDAWKTNKELAKLAKQESQHYMKLQRACTLMIPWFGEPDKGQVTERPKMWPVDLDSELDEVSSRLIYYFG